MSRSQRAAAAGALLTFSFALGSAGLVLPLLAIATGYDAAAVGLLSAVSAISHLGLRMQLPRLLGRFADRDLIAAASIMLAGSYGLLLFSAALPVFVLAQLLQGAARGLFWTSSQTHAVRTGEGSVSSMARVQVFASLGTLAGPAVSGLVIAASLPLALALGLVVGLLGASASRVMAHLPPFERKPRRRGDRIWQRKDVDLACWSSVTAGGWRALLSSYVPVVLEGARMPPSIIGLLLSLAEVSSIVSSGFLVRATPASPRFALGLAAVTSSASVALLPLVGAFPVLAGVSLLSGGAASGILITVGMALASDAVAPHERGEAIAVAGTFRAAALLATPAGIAASLSVVSLPLAVAIAGIALGIPAVAAGLAARPPAFWRTTS